MPNYGYRCQSCQREFEVLRRMSDPAQAACPDCGGIGTQLFYPAGILFKGSGFYKTDSRLSASAPSASSGDSPPSSDGAKPSDSAKASDGTKQSDAGKSTDGKKRQDAAGPSDGSRSAKPATSSNEPSRPAKSRGSTPTPAPASD